MTCRGTTRNSLAFVAIVALTAAWTACSEGSGNDGAAGSTASSTGGTTGTGSGGSGDTAGSGNDTGGTDGASGETGTGGTDGTDVTVVQEWTFDSGMEGWIVDGYSEPAGLSGNCTARWDDAEGDPDAGALEITIPFDATTPEQKAQLSLTLDAPVDFTGRILRLRVKLDSGLTSNLENPGGIKVFAMDQGSVWSNGVWQNLEVEAGWVTATLDPMATDYTDGTDFTDIIKIGVELVTNTGGSDYETAVVTIDTVQIVEQS